MKPLLLAAFLTAVFSSAFSQQVSAETPPSFSGIYPHLAMFNSDGECGTGVVVPWAGRLWVVTYSPHRPSGSDDKLYEITPELQQIIRPESIGGTPANRMIHQESQQLFIGPYAISQEGNVRVIPYTQMFGRPTGNARHLFEPAKKIYCASMEEALYEIDVETLAVTELWCDEAKKNGQRYSGLPGYHGKGLYSGYNRLIYSNNGERGKEAQTRPDIPSGALAEWDGLASQWNVVTRNQFTEVSGPDGIYGNLQPEKNPVWTIGWDHRSLILMCLYEGKWSRYRLVKTSHSYDGAHGWNTEWPRIREIGEDDLLMTMHGAFWRFPAAFRPGQTAGIRHRSAYLKIVADFCRWNDQLILACDDSAKNEFLNTRRAKGHLPGPAQSQSNLWFVKPEQLDQFGPAAGKGAVWLNDAVTRNEPSDPLHTGGFDQGTLFLKHDLKETVEFRLEGDVSGDGQWQELARYQIPAGSGQWQTLPLESPLEWIRVVSPQSLKTATAHFSLSRSSQKQQTNSGLFAALNSTSEKQNSRGGLVRAGDRNTGLQMLASVPSEQGQPVTGYYELKPNLELVRVEDAEKQQFMSEKVALKPDVLQLDGHSLLFVDDDGTRFRLPIGNPWFLENPAAVNQQRIAREVCTERDLLQAAGTFFELPARNAGGTRRIRPVSTHDKWIHDYCSWRGMMVLTGLNASLELNDPHVIQSADGQAAVWLGTVDDLWKLGRPQGTGGPWYKTKVAAGDVSDAYLIHGYGQKFLRVTANKPVRLQMECDVLGINQWEAVGEVLLTEENGVPTAELRIAGDSSLQKLTAPDSRFPLPESFSNASWIRFRADGPAEVTTTLYYE